MNIVAFTGLVASASGVLSALAPLLQAKRIRTAGDSSEVSVGVFAAMCANASIWFTYGIATADPVLMVPNLVAMLANTATLLVIRASRQGAAPGEVAVAGASPHATERMRTPLRSHAARARRGAVAVVRAGGLARR